MCLDYQRGLFLCLLLSLSGVDALGYELGCELFYLLTVVLVEEDIVIADEVIALLS